MVDKKTKYMELIDEVIQNGTYKDSWGSLSNYPEPEWLKNAKFGIFIHWGIYSVPAFGHEWYPRDMYIQDSEIYKHHIENYGNPKDFGYTDFIPMFKAEKFDADEWIDLFKSSGAKYVMPVAEHHDGFQMYDSQLSDWNAAKMGPQRDVVGELKESIEKNDMVFCASSHRAENFWFYSGARDFDSGIGDMEYQEPYGYAYKDFPREETGNIYSTPASKEHLDDWLARTCELVDKYQPKVVWFDWWIQNMSFKPYLKKFAAYYYNRSVEWGEQVAINYKYDAFAYDSAIFDVERGQLSEIRPRLWQTDTAIAKNSWGYTENNVFKDPVDIVCDLIDIVSKNGCLLLNVGPKSDGTITDEEKSILLNIGEWLKVNGESIYGTTYWTTYGEGSTEIPEGAFTDVNRDPFTSEDIRFTYKAPYIYANVLSWPDNNEVKIKVLRKDYDKHSDRKKYFLGHIEDVELLGFDNNMNFERNEECLKINVDGNIDTRYPVCFKIKID